MINLNKDNFVFKGFDPSEDLKIHGKEVYSRVEDKAPSESTKIAFINKTHKGYEGTFRVTSASGIFKVNSENRSAISLIDELYKKMSLQILDWSKTRGKNSNFKEK